MDNVRAEKSSLPGSLEVFVQCHVIEQSLSKPKPFLWKPCARLSKYSFAATQIIAQYLSKFAVHMSAYLLIKLSKPTMIPN